METARARCDAAIVDSFCSGEEYQGQGGDEEGEVFVSSCYVK